MLRRRSSPVGSAARSSRRGFTIVEALASTVLLGVGIAACMSAMGALARGETRVRDSERFTSLARSKYDELLLEDPNAGAGEETGDFADQGEPDVEWTWSSEASGIESLDNVQLTVRRRDGGEAGPRALLSGLRFRPPVATTTGATTP